MSNSLDQDRCSVGPDLGANCLQRLSADDKSYSYFSGQQAWAPKPTSGFDALVAHASEERNRALSNTNPSDERLFKSFDEPNRNQVSTTSSNQPDRRGPRTPSGSPPSRASKTPPGSPKRQQKSDTADVKTQPEARNRSRSASSCRSSSTSSRSRSSSRSSRSRSSSSSSDSSDDERKKNKNKSESKRNIPPATSKPMPVQKPPQPGVQQLPKYTLHLQNTTSIQNTIMYTAPMISQKGYKVTTNPVSSAPTAGKLPSNMKIVNSSNLSGGLKLLTGSNQSVSNQNQSAVPLQMALLPPNSNGVTQLFLAPSSGLSFHPVSSSGNPQVTQLKKLGIESKVNPTTSVSPSTQPVNLNTSNSSVQSSVIHQMPNLAASISAPLPKSAMSTGGYTPVITTTVSSNVQKMKTGVVQSTNQPPRTNAPIHAYSAPKSAAAQFPSAPRPRSRNSKPKQSVPPPPGHQYSAIVTLNNNFFAVPNTIYGLAPGLPDFSKPPTNLEALSRAGVLPVYNPNIQISGVQVSSKPSQNPTPAHSSPASKTSAPYSISQQFSAPSGALDPRSLLSPVPRLPRYSASATSPRKHSELRDERYSSSQVADSQGLLLPPSMSPRLPGNSQPFPGGQGYSRGPYSMEQPGLATVIGSMRADQQREGSGIHLQRFPGSRLLHEQPGPRSGFSVYTPRGKR